MAELTREQKQALAIAEAKLKLQQQQAGPGTQTQGWQPYTPSGERPGLMQNLAQIATSPQLAGGPMAMVGREGMRQADQLMDQGAYSAGGAVTDIASQAGASPEVAAGAGVVGNMGVRAIPTLVGALAGKAIEPATKPAGRALMQSALKPSSKDIASGDSAKAIETMLKGGFSATPGGVSKMRVIARSLSDDVDNIVANAKGTVDKDLLRAEIVEQLRKFRSQVNPKSDVSTILKAWDEFKATTGGKAPIDIQTAQSLKKGTYKILGDKYARMGQVQDEAGTQAQMALARGLRKGIEKAAPEVVPPNKRMTELINAIELAERRSGIAGNRDIAGLAWLADHPVAAGGMLADRSQAIKSLLARYLHSGMPATGAVGGTVYGNYDEMMRNQGSQ